MLLFKTNEQNLSSLKELAFKLERDLQKVFESNLFDLTQLTLVKSEFMIKNYRIDTLAFDEEAKAFVVIEYKRSNSNSVVDQGIAYLNLMLDYKAEFIIEYNERFNKSLLRSEVDWSQTKVIFVSPGFTVNQKQATNFKDLAIELWEVKQFEGEILTVNPIKKSKTAPSIKQLQGAEDTELKKVVNEIKVYAEEDHLQGKSEEVKELYEAFKDAILNLANDTDIKPKKQEIGFTRNRKIFTDICILKGNLKLWINLKRNHLDDPKKLARDVSSIGHWGNGDYEIIIKDTKDLEYIMSLVKQAIN
jgi:predicted transport protein